MNARKPCALNYLSSSTVPLNRLSRSSTTTERSKLADPSRVWAGGFNLEIFVAPGGRLGGAPTAARCETHQSRRTRPARIQIGPLTPAEIPRSLEFDWKGKRFSFEYPLITAVRQRGYVFSNGHSRFGLFLTI